LIKMANTENEKGEFSDLGKFKKIECKEINERKVCEMKFEKGRVTMLEEELNKICEK